MANGSDDTLEILIKLVADATGAKLTDEELSKLKAKVKETSEASSRANAEDEESTRKLLGSKYELRHIITGLAGQAVPQLSWALSSLAFGGGPIAAVFMMVGAFQMLRDHIKATNQAQLDFLADAAKGDSAAEAMATAVRDAANAEADYLSDLKKILDGQHGVTQELANQLQLTAAIQAAKQNALDAEKTLSVAKITKDQALGHISETEAITEKAAVEKKYLQDKARMEEDLFQQEQQRRQHAIDEAQNNRGRLEQEQAAAKKALDDANAVKALTSSAPTRDAVNKAQTDADEARKDAEAAEAELMSERQRRLGPMAISHAEETARNARDTANEKQAQADLAEKQFAQKAQADKLNIHALEKDLAEKTKAADDNAAALAKAKEDFSKAREVHDNPVVQKSKAEAESAAEQTVDVNMRGQLFKHAQEIQTKFNEHGGLTRQDAQELLDYLRIILQMRAAVRQGMEHALGGYVTKEQLQQEIAELRSLTGPRMRGSITGQ